MRLDDWRWSALARYDDAAQESGIVLLGLARQAVSQFESGDRIHVRIMTEMQTFCLNARKAIEILDILKPGMKAEARSRGPHAPGMLSKDLPSGVTCTESSFWWIISRILHSVSVMVYAVFEDRPNDYAVVFHRYFQFSSERDQPQTDTLGLIKAGVTHLVSIELLVRLYSYFARAIDETLEETRYRPSTIMFESIRRRNAVASSLNEEVQQQILRFVDSAVPGKNTEVWLCGSRAEGTERADRDWDVVAFTTEASLNPGDLFRSIQVREIAPGVLVELVIAHPDHKRDPRPYMRDLGTFGFRLR
jgi:hypothetical protein